MGRAKSWARACDATAVVFALSSSVSCSRGKPDLVSIDGSSTVFPITEAVAEEFQKQGKQVRVTVGISGTGGGFKKLCAGEIDVADASRPIKPSEVELCRRNGVEYVELPIAYDGITLVVHPKNTWTTSMTVADLKKIWEPEAQGKVVKWSDVRPEWPDKPLRLYGAGVDSGTYDYFTEAVVGTEHSSRGDYTSSEDDNVLVQGVASDESALGFLGYAYYANNRARLHAVKIDDGKPGNGNGPIEPSIESVRNGEYQPLARPMFIYASKEKLGRASVEQFVEFYLGSAAHLVEEVHFVPLPGRAYGLGKDRLRKRVVGSMFGGRGSQVGVSIEALMDREG